MPEILAETLAHPVLREPFDYYDISPLVSESTAVFPGDQPYQRTVVLDFAHGDNLVLSKITTTPHLGAHADATVHFHPSGTGIGERELDPYLGSAQVITVRLPRGERIRPQHIAHTPITSRRVLLKTGSFPDPDRWNGDFNSLSAELLDDLAAKEVFLVGIDTPSVDPAEDKGLEAHHALYRHEIANLEGLVLGEVPDGTYTLVALPLRLKNMDASPVRAILIKHKI